MAEGSDEAVVIERTFDAPVAMVWRMWTEPEQFRMWYGPDGARVPEATMDVRVGGIRRICLEVQTPEGPARMWFAGEYREVVENERLVYTESAADEHGDVAGQAGHPAHTQVVVELSDVGGRTRMVMTHVGIPADSPGAVGWAMAFGKLAALLERG
jgi:uncharacterized protein YndB with AHSA1/START domain